MTTYQVTAADRKFDVTCSQCGRTESFTGTCSYCFRGRTPAEAHVAGRVNWPVRRDAVNAVGWESPILANEVRQSPSKILHDAAKAGYSEGWPKWTRKRTGSR